MNRRAFLLGAAAAPIAAPAVAKAAASYWEAGTGRLMVGIDLARGGSVVGGAFHFVGERGAEHVIPAGSWKIISPDVIANDIRRRMAAIVDSGETTITVKPGKTVVTIPAV